MAVEGLRSARADICARLDEIHRECDILEMERKRINDALAMLDPAEPLMSMQALEDEQNVNVNGVLERLVADAVEEEKAAIELQPAPPIIGPAGFREKPCSTAELLERPDLSTVESRLHHRLKVCNTCHATKNLDNDFGVLTGSPDGHNNKCKWCLREYMRAREIRQREVRVANAARWYALAVKKDQEDRRLANVLNPEGRPARRFRSVTAKAAS